MMRAFFGGSFDPFHAGHLAIIQTILDRGLADEVLVVPAGHNPQKPDPPAPGPHRLRMAELGVAGLAGVRVLDSEAERSGPTYTVDTLAALAAQTPGDRWRLVLGGDNLADFGSWRDPDRLLALAQLLVFPRGAAPLTVPPGLAGRALIVEGFFSPVSATAVRATVAAGGRPGKLVPQAVLDYIVAHGLYRRGGGGRASAPGREALPCP